MKQPLILELKGNSLDDGPGIRTVVFVKGCPLSCGWCHNPESKRACAELSFSRRDCIGCGLCRQACPENALHVHDPQYIDRRKCKLCFACADICPAKALTRVGRALTIDDIVESALGDKPFYAASGGGVTLSGGEITMFPAFAGKLLRRLKAHGIHTLIETCGHFPWGLFEEHMLPFIDAIYYDLKLYRLDLHKRHCGAGNEIILENYKRLHALSKQRPFTLLPRTPLIPGITDTDENLTGIADFLVAAHAGQAQLLSYNPTWLEKNQKLGAQPDAYYESEQKWQGEATIQHCERIFIERGIELL